MIKTEFFSDFVEYYQKARFLQEGNLIPNAEIKVSDPLMDNVSIYDTIHRRQAGFSKALEDIHGKRMRKDLSRYGDFSDKLNSTVFHFIHLVHRFTGSGASFQPRILQDGSLNPKEHGYCNNIVGELAGLASIRGDQAIPCMRELITTWHLPMVTSVGNQPPSLKNPDPKKYRLAQQYYFDQIAEHFVNDYLTFLINNEYRNNAPTGIKEAVDFSCGWHKDRKFKQWHFVLTAFVMDTAEYYPELVDPNSHCYYGANCIKTFDLIFIPENDAKRKFRADWYEECMTELCKAVGGKPYDIEDVCCDYIRYVKEHIPKGYEHLTQEQRVNNSTLKQNGVYPTAIIERINKILG